MKKEEIIATFLIVCLPLRLLLAFAAYKKYFKYLWIITAIMAFGFFYNVNNKNKGFFGSVRYWNSAVHGTLYLLFTAAYLLDYKFAYLFLLADAIVGAGYFIKHYA